MTEDPLFRKGSVTSSKFDSYPDKGREREFVLCVCVGHVSKLADDTSSELWIAVQHQAIHQSLKGYFSKHILHDEVTERVTETKTLSPNSNPQSWLLIQSADISVLFWFFLSMVIDLALSVRLCARARMLTYRNSSCTRPVKRPIRVQHDPDQSNLAYRRH